MRFEVKTEAGEGESEKMLIRLIRKYVKIRNNEDTHRQNQTVGDKTQDAREWKSRLI